MKPKKERQDTTSWPHALPTSCWVFWIPVFTGGRLLPGQKSGPWTSWLSRPLPLSAFSLPGQAERKQTVRQKSGPAEAEHPRLCRHGSLSYMLSLTLSAGLQTLATLWAFWWNCQQSPTARVAIQHLVRLSSPKLAALPVATTSLSKTLIVRNYHRTNPKVCGSAQEAVTRTRIRRPPSSASSSPPPHPPATHR